MFENFPYTDMHQLNLDWIIKIAKDFLDQYTHIQELITTGEENIQNLTDSGLEQLQTKANDLETLLQQWYNTHSADIANQLADALEDLNNWYTAHQGYLDQYLTESITAFGVAAESKALQTIETIPADYSTLSASVESLAKYNPENVNELIDNKVSIPITNWIIGYFNINTHEFKTDISDGTYVRTDFIPLNNTVAYIKNNMRTGGGVAGWGIFDINKTCIRTGKSEDITINAGDAFIVFTDLSLTSDHSGRIVDIYSDTLMGTKATTRALVNTILRLTDSFTYNDFYLLNGYARYNNGVIMSDISDGTYMRTNYIEIPANCSEIITNFTIGGVTGIVFYDDQKQYVIGYNDNSHPVPVTAKYFIITDYKASGIHNGIYIKFISASPIHDNLTENIISNIMKNTGNFIYTGFPLVLGYARYNNGVIMADVNDGTYMRTSYMTIPESCNSITSNFNIAGVTGIVFYDANFQYLIGFQANTSIIPSNAKYFIITDYNINATHDNLYIEFNSNTAETVNSWMNKNWVALGDSWTEGTNVPVNGRYTDLVSEYLGLTCLNLGDGGASIATFADSLTSENAGNADLITIWGSINDMAINGVPCGDITDTPSNASDASLMAKWKYTIEKTLAINPRAVIVIITCPVAFDANRTGYNPYNSNGDTIASSTAKIKELARYYNLPCVDMYELSGFNGYNFNNGYFDYDKVHPNAKGVRRVSNILIEQLLMLQPLYNT